MGSQGTAGLDRLIKAFCYSLQGFKAAFVNEAAFRQEVILSIFLVPLGIWFGETGAERALLVGVLFLVIIVELGNSAIEAVVDRFGGEIHELSGRAKDVGSAAVLIALINVIFVWSLVLLT
jgi:diacylglycerol kinase (ATP)